VKPSRWTRRLLKSTRGQIILLLRGQPRTVAELAETVSLTDNAVRAHLATLERDGLVHQTGERAGFRKPHFSYELTSEADELFPKAYGRIFNRLVAVLKDRFGVAKTEALLREVGRRVAEPEPSANEAAFTERLDQAVESLGNLGGHAAVTREDGKLLIRAAGCPLAAATADHREVCKMVETFLSKIIGAPVRQACRREPSPRCCFEIQSPANKKKRPPR